MSRGRALFRPRGFERVGMCKLVWIVLVSSVVACDTHGPQVAVTQQGSTAAPVAVDLGPLDPLCVLHDGRGYDELLDHSVELADEDIVIRVLDLPTLIQVKSATGRVKDKLVVPLLAALLDEEE